MNDLKENKQIESRKRLLNSLDEKNHFAEKQRRIISESFNAIKNGLNKKRIVFDNDDLVEVTFKK